MKIDESPERRSESNTPLSPVRDKSVPRFSDVPLYQVGTDMGQSQAIRSAWRPHRPPFRGAILSAYLPGAGSPSVCRHVIISCLFFVHVHDYPFPLLISRSSGDAVATVAHQLLTHPFAITWLSRAHPRPILSKNSR